MVTHFWLTLLLRFGRNLFLCSRKYRIMQQHVEGIMWFLWVIFVSSRFLRFAFSLVCLLVIGSYQRTIKWNAVKDGGIGSYTMHLSATKQLPLCELKSVALFFASICLHTFTCKQCFLPNPVFQG